MKAKKEIREKIRRKLKAQGQRKRSEQSRRIHKSLFRLDLFKKSKCLLIYLSLPEEVDTLRVIKRCLSMGKRVVVPKMNVRRGVLELREVTNLERDVEKGVYGVVEPRPRSTRRVSPQKIDCMILPGLAFDAGGNRLGRGRGFFDKLLNRIKPGIPRIALAFPFQIMDRLPVESHDRPVDVLLSS